MSVGLSVCTMSVCIKCMTGDVWDVLCEIWKHGKYMLQAIVHELGISFHMLSVWRYVSILYYLYFMSTFWFRLEHDEEEDKDEDKEGDRMDYDEVRSDDEEDHLGLDEDDMEVGQSIYQWIQK